VEFTIAQGEAFEDLQKHYSDFFGTPTTKYGLRPEQITDPDQIRQLTAFFCWSAWVSSALRPERDYSYTNNWPPEPLVGNQPTAANYHLEHAFTCRIAGWRRAVVRSVWPVEFPRLAWARAADPLVSRTW